MKIVFGNREELEGAAGRLAADYCPGEFGLAGWQDGQCRRETAHCRKCWVIALGRISEIEHTPEGWFYKWPVELQAEWIRTVNNPYRQYRGMEPLTPPESRMKDQRARYADYIGDIEKLKAEGLNSKQIAEALGLAGANKVNGMVYRYRRSLKKKEAEA